MSVHEVQWVTAAPLWERALNQSGEAAQVDAMRAPAIIRFASDDFMTELSGVLDRRPADLRLLRAQPRSFRIPPPGETEPRKLDVLKLYQPAHGDFYLVAASLVCRLPGLPDREVDVAAQEQVAFILRRLAEGSEWAWVANPRLPKGKGWKRVGKRTGRKLAKNEELLPLFPVTYQDGERRRRLFVGLVPTSSRESFGAAGTFSPLAEPGAGEGAPALDPRPEELERILTRPMEALAAPATGPAPTPEATQALEAQKQEASRFVLLDVAEFLYVNARSVWEALAGTRPAGAPGALWDVLENNRADTARTITWRKALTTAWDERARIAGDDETPSTLGVNVGRSALAASTLVDRITAVLPAEAPPPGTGTTTASKGGADDEPLVPKLDPTGEGRYVLRCVYRRPQCGPIHPELVGARSDEFSIASFFDVDAPARPIQIGFPINTSIKSLRQARKNVNILLSNELRQQMTRATDLKKAMEGNLASGQSFDIGMMCSFSIPIITICALIVLMIFISLLNIVFWWMPFLRICFPILAKAK